MEKIWVVVPCYNEEKRFNRIKFEHLLTDKTIQLLLVDDGSTDNTLQILEEFQQQHPSQAHLLCQKRNIGKAESIRAGMLLALNSNASMIGYLDADLATPIEEYQRLVALMLKKENCAVLMGCRLNRLGASIHRPLLRHYLGRFFATLASLILNIGVYDTQCGAKIFRTTPALIYALSFPFQSRWAFDVEFLSRLLYPIKEVSALSQDLFFEEPLLKWNDIEGSKLDLKTMLKSGLDLWGINKAIKNRQK